MAQAPQLPGDLPLARMDQAEDPQEIYHITCFNPEKKSAQEKSPKARGVLHCFCEFI